MPDLSKKEFEFKEPVSESQLQDILESTMQELNLDGQWHFEHGYQHNNLVSQAMCESLHGFIKTLDEHHAIAEITAGPWIDAAKEPRWGNIEFSPAFGCEVSDRLYPEYIDRLYETFCKKYEFVMNKGKK